MKLIKFLFVFFTLVILGLYGYLFSLDGNITLSAELNTEIPEPVAFKQLILTTTHRPYSGAQALDSIRIRLVYFKKDKPLAVTYRPVADFNRFRLKLLPVDSSRGIQPFKSITHTVYLQKLVDGTTNIRWELRYQIKGIYPRLLNHLFWEPQLRSFLADKINELKAFYH